MKEHILLKKTHADHLKEIEQYYKPKIIDGVPDYQILGWENRQAHLSRFQTLMKTVDLSGKTLLDIGCGLGTLYDYIAENKINVKYTGVDILEEMIRRARERHKGIEFSCIDIFDEKAVFDREFDVVFASGIFNLNLGNNKRFIERALDRFFSVADQIIAFNLLHEDSENKEERYFYSNPAEINRLLLVYAGKFQEAEFYHSYLKNDFTVIIRR